MKRCFGYVRVSTVKQGEGVSLEEQRDAISRYAEKHDLAITQWFEEKQTAAKSGRPVFNQMIKLLRAGKAQGLITHKVDRSARNLRDWALISELPDQGIDLYVATENLDFRSRGGRLTADIQAVIAADFIRNNREETIKGLRGRLKQGLYPFRAPLGYLDTGKGNPKAVDPIKAPLVRKLFEAYASGRHSLRSLQSYANEIGLTNYRGRPLALNNITRLLNNPFYFGLIEIKRSGATYEGAHEPIISAGLFRTVRDVKSGKAGPKVTRHNHPFQGVFRCGCCGDPMRPELQKSKYLYYRCHRKNCETKTIRHELVDKAVYHELKLLQISMECAETLLQGWREQDEKDTSLEEIIGLELQLKDCVSKQERLLDLLVAGTIVESVYQRKTRDLKFQEASLRERISQAGQNDNTFAHRQKFVELVENLAGLYETLEPDEKREFIKNTWSNCKVIGKKVVLEPREWLQDLTCPLPDLLGAPTQNKGRNPVITDEQIEAILEQFAPLLPKPKARSRRHLFGFQYEGEDEFV